MPKPRTGKFINCFSCNKKFYIPINRFDKSKYCSRKCRDINNTIKITSNCTICVKEFTHISSRCNKAKYCSRLCYHRSQRNKGKTEYTCKFCNIKFMSSASKKRQFCSNECNKKDRTKGWNPGFLWIRKYMKKRDLIKKCNRCGFNNPVDILGVHHIDRNRHNNDLSNLEVLCPNCHSIEHMKHTPHGFKE